MTIKRNMVPLLGIAFVVAIAATGIFYGLFVGKIRAASDAQNQPVVAAARNLDRGTVIKAADLKLISWQSGAAPKGAFQAPDQAVGKMVVAPVGEGELVTAAKLQGPESVAGGLSIPAGMRAISVTVSESQGIMSFLRTGQRVDIQVVSARSSQDAELRAIIQNLEVLAIHQAEAGGNKPATTMLTILASPQDADRLALADSGARVRVLLRNTADKDQGPRPGLAIAQLFNDRGHPVNPQPAAAVYSQATPAPVAPVRQEVVEGKFQLAIRVAGATSEAVEELSNGLGRMGQSLRVSAFQPDVQPEVKIKSLTDRRWLEIVSATELTTSGNREVSLETGAKWNAANNASCGLRIQFVPAAAAGGRLRIRVQPEITSPQASSVSSTKIETELDLANGQPFLVTALGMPGEPPSLIERLFSSLLICAGREDAPDRLEV